MGADHFDSLGRDRTESRGNVYIISDVHLGLPTSDPSEERARELRFCQLLQSIADDCAHLILLGDIFDFWFEYRHVVPRGHIRALGMLAWMADRGIPIDYFTGNHDMWLRDYLVGELGLRVHRAPLTMVLQGVRMQLGHGDGLGPGGIMYKCLKRAFGNRLLQLIFRALHPSWGFRIARGWSRSSRMANYYRYRFRGAQEPLAQYARDLAARGGPRLCIMGHLHSGCIHREEPLLGSPRALVLLGEWIVGASYVRISPQSLDLLEFLGPGQGSRRVDSEPLQPYRER